MTRTETLRRHLDLKQFEFAERLGVRQSAVCRWERGERAPNGSADALMDMLARDAGRPDLTAEGFAKAQADAAATVVAPAATPAVAPTPAVAE